MKNPSQNPTKLSQAVYTSQEGIYKADWSYGFKHHLAFFVVVFKNPVIYLANRIHLGLCLLENTIIFNLTCISLWEQNREQLTSGENCMRFVLNHGALQICHDGGILGIFESLRFFGISGNYIWVITLLSKSIAMLTLQSNGTTKRLSNLSHMGKLKISQNISSKTIC